MDEIGEMKYTIQAKLLRVIEDKSVSRIGTHKDKKINVRILAATNQDLQKMIENKTFRADLFHRLNILNIQMPPLREHKEDIPELFDHFTQFYIKKLDKEIKRIDRNILPALQKYNFPGNVRELKNMIERAVIMCDSEILTMDCFNNLDLLINENKYADSTIGNYLSLPAIEREAIVKALHRSKNNKSKAAKMLSISRQALDQAEAEFKVAEQKLAQSLDQQQINAREVQIARAQLGQRQLRAPFDGVVIDRLAHPGERVEDRPLMRIASIDRLRAEVVVPAAQFGSLAEGMPAWLTPGLPGASAVPAIISLVDPVIDPASNTFRIRLSLDNTGHKVPAGVRCTVDFEQPALSDSVRPGDRRPSSGDPATGAAARPTGYQRMSAVPPAPEAGVRRASMALGGQPGPAASAAGGLALDYSLSVQPQPRSR